jgi:osmotically-inducible protein OsmY
VERPARDLADSAVHRLKGVKGVSNLVHVKPRVTASQIKQTIEEAFKRSATIDANRITVETSGEVILRGRECAPGPSVKRPSAPPGQPLV